MNPVEQYYDHDNHNEWERLTRRRTEFAVTLRALAEFLAPAPVQILDVGGGPGRYAIELACRGYSVTLVDLSYANITRATEKAQVANVQLAGTYHGNALDLSAFANATYDAVLLLGPLYHLLAEHERLQAICEAYRVLKPRGVVFAAFCTRYSAIRVCAELCPEWLADNSGYADQVLRAGVHQGEWGWTHAYYAHPLEIAPLMERAGFATLELIGCEGVVAGHEEQINALQGAAWEWWANLNYQLGKDLTLHGAAIHLLYVGRK
jgi:ubiquinone/menaquinone biosynthesis C-methylase UbiE